MIKTFLTKTLIVVFFPLTFLFAQPNIQTGSWSADQSVAGYSLDQNTGERIVLIEISFIKPFKVIPEVIISVSQLDTDTKANQRFYVEPISISKEGFIVKVTTWADSRVYSIGGFWLAISKE